jgi:hypothetical protein
MVVFPVERINVMTQYIWIVVDYDSWEYPIYYGAFQSQEAAEAKAAEMRADVEKVEFFTT